MPPGKATPSNGKSVYFSWATSKCCALLVGDCKEMGGAEQEVTKLVSKIMDDIYIYMYKQISSTSTY